MGIAMQAILPLLLMLWCPLVCVAAERHGEDLAEFIVGRYQLIGKESKTAATYAGNATIARSGAGLTVRRTIEGRTVAGTVVVERAMADAIPVVRIRFVDRGVPLEQTCLVTSDLDNWPRLTCQVYERGTTSGVPGLETYFPEQ
jgi:hypothetical protein